jgi:AAA domain
MRIRRLDFLKYGHFTNTGFDLPHHAPNFHIGVRPERGWQVYGAMRD